MKYDDLELWLYLFVIDLVGLNYPKKNDYDSFCDREPGYDKCLIQAYITAFSHKAPTIDIALIQSIHAAAMNFPSREVAPGQFDTHPCKFSVVPVLREGATYAIGEMAYNATIQGLSEFINYWIVEKTKPIHFMMVSSDTEQKTIFFYKQEGQFIFRDCFDQKTATLNKGKFIEKIKDFFLNSEYTCFITREFRADASVKNLLEIIVQDYNKKIVYANGANEKISLIAKCVQQIDQLHPFGDGNLRTCYVLLNLLLRNNQLPLCLLLNPNRIDCSSHAELIEMIQLGQIYYQQYIHHINTTPKSPLTFNATHEPFEEMQKIECLPEHIRFDKALVVSFMDKVLYSYQPDTGLTGASTFFAKPIKEEIQDKLEELIRYIKDDPENVSLVQALTENKFNLALRRACGKCNDPTIIDMILELNALDGTLDPMKQSSNGKNAFDWLKENTALSTTQKDEIQVKLEKIISDSSLKKQGDFL